jgi:hypothetical protein
MSYRECDPNVIKKQIGLWSWASLGIKYSVILKESDADDGAYVVGLQLVLKHGRLIEIRLMFDDTYEIKYRRIIQRGALRGQVVEMAYFEGVYADSLSRMVEDRYLVEVEAWHKSRSLEKA